jgi:competence protein ComEC
LAFLLGDILASILSFSLQLWLSLAGIAFVIWLHIRRKPAFLSKIADLSIVSFLVFALVIMFLGAARFQSAQRIITPISLAYYNESEAWVEITGLLIEPALDRDTYIELRVRAEQLQLPDSAEFPVEGMVLARTSIDNDWQYGDRLILRGRLETAPVFEDFSYRDYLARQGIDSLLSFAQVARFEAGQGSPYLAALYSFRDHALDKLYRLYPDPEASLLAGILLGDETGISDSLKDDFNTTGARHIIAISGFNITIIAGFLLSAFKRAFGLNRAAWLTVAAIFAYTLLVGADASVVRAAIMGSLALFARQVGRRQMALNTLAFTAAVMALFNPSILWDVGFQLSFFATLGLVLYAEPLSNWTQKQLAQRVSEDWAARATSPIADYFLFTIAAQLTTLPLLIYYFQRLSLLSLPTNILILPAQPAVMILGGFSVLLALIWLPLGQIVAFAAWPMLAYTIRIVELLAQPVWSSKALAPLSLALVVIYYLVLFTLTFRPFNFDLKRIKLQPAVIIATILILNIWIWSAALSAPKGQLQMTLLDVGNGEAILIRTPEGRNLLINGGESELRLAEALGRALPPFDHRIDWLIVAAVEEEQIGALPGSLERLSPDALAWSGLPFASYESRLLRAETLDLEIDLSNLKAGSSFDLGLGAQLGVLGVTDRGAVLLLHMQGFRALLPIGINLDLIKDWDWGKELGRVDAILLADGGNPELNPPDWLENLNPRIILLSVDSLSSAAFPPEELSDVLQNRTLLRTDRDGWIRLTANGEQLRIESER